jgi:hypothetical protein
MQLTHSAWKAPPGLVTQPLNRLKHDLLVSQHLLISTCVPLASLHHGERARAAQDALRAVPAVRAGGEDERGEDRGVEAGVGAEAGARARQVHGAPGGAVQVESR